MERQRREVKQLKEIITELQEDLEHYKNQHSEKYQTFVELNVKEIDKPNDEILEKYIVQKHISPDDVLNSSDSKLVSKSQNEEHASTNNFVSKEATNWSGSSDSSKTLRNTQSVLSIQRRLVLPIPTPKPKVNIAFHAVNTASTSTMVQKVDNIEFDTVKLNIGTIYNVTNGVATITEPGLYLFSVSILNSNENFSEIHVELLKNAEVLARTFARGENGKLDQGTITVVTYANEGDRIWVGHRNVETSAYLGLKYTSFTGVLIAQM
ncbi:C1q and tumor necrosis factor protein 4 [Mactra antiquata]